MCEQAETFCRKTWTGLVQVAHLKVSVRAGLDIVSSLVCWFVVWRALQRRSGRAQGPDFIIRICRLRVSRHLIKMGQLHDH